MVDVTNLDTIINLPERLDHVLAMVNYATRGHQKITRFSVSQIIQQREVIFARYGPVRDLVCAIRVDEWINFNMLRVICVASSFILNKSVVMVIMGNSTWRTYDFCQMNSKVYLYVRSDTDDIHAHVQT